MVLHAHCRAVSEGSLSAPLVHQVFEVLTRSSTHFIRLPHLTKFGRGAAGTLVNAIVNGRSQKGLYAAT